MSIILALLVFSVLVLFHEFGHFLLAKKNGIGVTEFSLGLGPRILSFEKGGTRRVRIPSIRSQCGREYLLLQQDRYLTLFLHLS